MPSGRWLVRKDVYGRDALLKRIEPAMPGAAAGWERVASADEFDEVREALDCERHLTRPQQRMGKLTENVRAVLFFGWFLALAIVAIWRDRKPQPSIQ